MRFNRPYRLDDEISFGKYKDDTILEIIKTDPSYLGWALENVEGFELDAEAFEALSEAIDIPSYL